MVDMYQKCLSGMEWPDALSALPYIVFRSGGVRAELCGEGVAGNAGSAQTRLSRIRGMGIVLQMIQVDVAYTVVLRYQVDGGVVYDR